MSVSAPVILVQIVAMAFAVAAVILASVRHPERLGQRRLAPERANTFEDANG